MTNNRLQEIIFHPAFLSFIVWIVLILLIPPFFTKFRVEKISEEYNSDKIKYIFQDLDADGNSERISFDVFDREQTKIVVNKSDKILDQYNLKYLPPFGLNSVYFGDYNNDGCLECYVFTISKDSIFLHVIDPVVQRKILITMRYIDIWKRASQSSDAPYIEPVGMTEGVAKNIMNFVFTIITGYSKQPRNVYCYMPDVDSLIKSPKNSVLIDRCTVSEIDSSAGCEFILSTRASGNFEENAPYSDQYSWFMVLKNDLKFLFPPIKFSENPSKLVGVPLRLKRQTCIVLLNDYYGIEDISSYFYLFDSKGNKLYEKAVADYDRSYAQLFANENNDNETFYFLKNRGAEIEELDSTFNILRTITIPVIAFGDPLANIDANLDGKKELIFSGRDNKSIVIVQNDFSHPVVYHSDTEINNPYITQFLEIGKKPLLFLQMDNLGTYLLFDKNPFYYVKYPFYGILYLVVLLFFTMIYRIQKHRLDQKLQTEKEIASLQMKAIKNQIDPHFTLNILNAIGSLYATDENRDKADYVFAKYAKLIRQTVISSDQIIIPMEEELDFVRNFLDLEHFRCNASFDYHIEIGDNVDLQTKIPRTLIHTFIENAVKYGIKKRPGTGIIKILIQNNTKTLDILIEDNGPGLGSDDSTGEGTGKGLIIVSELADLYYRLEKIKITATLQNILDASGTILGARAKIEVPFAYP